VGEIFRIMSPNVTRVNIQSKMSDIFFKLPCSKKIFTCIIFLSIEHKQEKKLFQISATNSQTIQNYFFVPKQILKLSPVLGTNLVELTHVAVMTSAHFHWYYYFHFFIRKQFVETKYWTSCVLWWS
jgi:hypothetical protein